MNECIQVTHITSAVDTAIQVQLLFHILFAQGTPGCLSGLVFVVTGVLETIDRDQAAALIKQYGGRVTSSVSRNTSYLVVGDEPGPAKIEKVPYHVPRVFVG